MKVEEGPGWRLIVDASRTRFPVLIGGERWAAEFTAVEALALAKGISRLVEQHRALVDQLMAEEAIDLELELPLESDSDRSTTPAGSLWLGLEGDRNRWQLSFVLTSGDLAQRSFEGAWTPAASPPLAAALGSIELPFGPP